MHKARLLNSKQFLKYTNFIRSSYKGRTADALALDADERRDKLR